MRIFLTGATGYIGSALCRRLARDGHQLRALARPTSQVDELRALGVRLFEGDVTDRYSMREAMSGADWVVHAAAELDLAAPRERMRRVNVEGSRNVASLAFKLGVGRLLSVSSVAYFGGSPADGSAATEESPLQLPLPSNYSLTKHEGQEVIREEMERGLPVNTVYPSLVYGPPLKGRGLNTMIRAFARRRLPAVVGADRRSSWIYLEDLVEGITRVMERAEPGRDYLLAGEMAPIGDLVERVCSVAGVQPPRWRISVRTASVLTALTAPFNRWRRRRPSARREQLRNVARHWHFDDARARAELDWQWRSLDEGLPPTLAAIERT